MRPKGVVVFSDASTRDGCIRGSRELPALEQVANRPIAHHVLDALYAVGVDDIVIAGSADALIDVSACLRQYSPQPSRIEYVPCASGGDVMSALHRAAPLVAGAPCVVHLADGLLGEPLAPHMTVFQDGSPELIVLCHGPASCIELTRSVSLPGTPLAISRGMLHNAGVGLFGPGAFRQACTADGLRRTFGLDVLAEHLTRHGGDVQIRPVDDWRRYRGDPADLLELNRLALDSLARERTPTSGRDNRIEGRVHLDPTASISESVIVGPVVIGAGAEVHHAYIGPYTSIGPRARIEGVEVERSIISPRASVIHVGGRLVSSLIGREARVYRDFSLPRAMRLQIADGDEVALC
jgi:glucose-1-phosphate thymidylyltransferase